MKVKCSITRTRLRRGILDKIKARKSVRKIYVHGRQSTALWPRADPLISAEATAYAHRDLRYTYMGILSKML